MAQFFDLRTSEGQFRALLVLYIFTVLMRCLGHQWMENDHTLMLGAILALLRSQASAQ